jgi:hypothetical protein
MPSFEPIKLVEIVADEVGTPRNDGSPGSALYQVPIRLSSTPPLEWGELFVRTWNRPPRFTSMHRPGIASVSGDRVILNGTTLEELEQYHRATLLLVVDETNKQYSEFVRRAETAKADEGERNRRHREEIKRKSQQIKFDSTQ